VSPTIRSDLTSTLQNAHRVMSMPSPTGKAGGDRRADEHIEPQGIHPEFGLLLPAGRSAGALPRSAVVQDWPRPPGNRRITCNLRQLDAEAEQVSSSRQNPRASRTSSVAHAGHRRPLGQESPPC